MRAQENWFRGLAPQRWRRSGLDGRFRAAMIAALVSFTVLMPTSHGSFPDEIQVYTDAISAPRELGMQLHVNKATQPRAPENGFNPHDGLRMTLELSYGLTETVEAGAYLPTLRDRDGDWQAAGAKLRLLWLPIGGNRQSPGWFAGVSGELAQMAKRFSDARSLVELRTIGGYRGENWLFAVNPVFAWPLSDGQWDARPEVEVNWKVARKIPGVSSMPLALGVEYYQELGRVGDFLSRSEQARTLYGTIDLEHEKFSVNLGIGRGFGTADRRAIKTIINVPF